MTELKQTNPEEAVPQSTRLLQDLLVQRAKIELLEQELATLRALQEQTANALAQAQQQIEMDAESASKAFGLLAHELEVARAIAAHVKADAAEERLKQEALLQETIQRLT